MRTLHDKSLPDSVETLRTFVNEETEYAVHANETIYGLKHQENPRMKPQKTFFLKTDARQKQSVKCQICRENHNAWECMKFKAMNVEERWKQAKVLDFASDALKVIIWGKNVD